MSNSPKLLANIVTKFVDDLPADITSAEIGGILCSILYEYNMTSDVHICEGVLNVMLEHDMRDDERAAQAADEFLARAAAKSRK